MERSKNTKEKEKLPKLTNQVNELSKIVDELQKDIDELKLKMCNKKEAPSQKLKNSDINPQSNQSKGLGSSGKNNKTKENKLEKEEKLKKKSKDKDITGISCKTQTKVTMDCTGTSPKIVKCSVKERCVQTEGKGLSLKQKFLIFYRLVKKQFKRKRKRIRRAECEDCRCSPDGKKLKSGTCAKGCRGLNKQSVICTKRRICRKSSSSAALNCKKQSYKNEKVLTKLRNETYCAECKCLINSECK